MHVSPSDFRTVRRDGILLHFAVLGDIAYVLVDIPRSGSGGTFVEDWCERPHWAFTVTGSVDIDFDGSSTTLPQGSAVHVPAGIRHRFVVPGRAHLAGFERLAPGTPRSVEDLRQFGFEAVGSGDADSRSAFAVVRPKPQRPPEAGEVVAVYQRMGDFLFTRSSLGEHAGYTSDHCDLPHWGLVTSGSLVIEWEDDIEVLAAGDVFHCPAGPPGHRLQAADPAVVLDFTPIDAIRTTERIVEWRRQSTIDALAESSAPPRLEVAALV